MKTENPRVPLGRTLCQPNAVEIFYARFDIAPGHSVVVPANPGVNPSLTIVAMTERVMSSVRDRQPMQAKS